MTDENGRTEPEVTAEDLAEYAREKAEARDALNREPDGIVIIVEEAGELAAALDGREPDRSWLEPDNLAEVRRMLAAMRYPDRPPFQRMAITGTNYMAQASQPPPERWRTVLNAGPESPEPVDAHWTTCLRHVNHGGRIHVCTLARDHGDADEPGETVHLDVNSGVAWTSHWDVWELEPETAVDRWRYWLSTRNLDTRSTLLGAAGMLFWVAIIVVTWWWIAR